MKDLAALTEALKDYVKNSENNRIPKDKALAPELAGLKIYEAPLVGAAPARDPLFKELKKEEALGPHALLPEEWMAEGETVLSFFLPYTESIKKANGRDGRLPASEWLHGRFEGQDFLMQACAYVKRLLEEEGAKALIPAEDKRFRAAEAPPAGEPRSRGFTSNWSERHAAFICGLGTFGLSKGLITKKGVAGRFASLITDKRFAPTERDYTRLYQYCTGCGACIRRCPVHAISFEDGKRHEPCSKFLDFTKEKYAPRYGCGKCQTAVPCESRIPL